MALSLGLALSVHLRRRQGSLVFAATRLSGDPARRLHDGTFQARIPDGKMVRFDLYNSVRASGGDPRQLARSANVGGRIPKPREEQRKRARCTGPAIAITGDR